MNIEQARFNMIEQQIRPTNVSSSEVLELLMRVKREDFFPEDQRNLVFFDTELPLLRGVNALSPKLEARIVQEVAAQKNESVLVVGADSGYVAALLAHQARHVTVIEAIPELKARVEDVFKRGAYANVDVIWGDALQGQGISQFDVIVVTGSLEAMPELLRERLNVGGRLFVVLGMAPVMTATLINRESELFFNTRALFETSLARLSQAVPANAFTL